MVSVDRTIAAGHRLIHDGAQVIALFEADAGVVTETHHTIYVGTLDECRVEITRLGLAEEAFGNDPA